MGETVINNTSMNDTKNNMSFIECVNEYDEKRHRSCVYCNISNRHIDIGNHNLLSIDKNRKKIVATHFNKRNTLLGMADIQYCPICGRRL